MNNDPLSFATLGNAIGYATHVSGTVQVHSIDGAVRVLNVGNSIYYAEQIVALNDGSATILFNDGTSIIVNNQSVIEMTDEILSFQETFNEVLEDQQELLVLQHAILDGADPTLIQNAPAAGESELQGDDSILSISIERENDLSLPTFGFDTYGSHPILVNYDIEETSNSQNNVSTLPITSIATQPTQPNTPSAPSTPAEEPGEPATAITPIELEPPVSDPSEGNELTPPTVEPYYASIDLYTITDDKTINATESTSGNMISLSGWVAGDARPGDIVSIALEGSELGQAPVSEVQDDLGRYLFSVEIAGADLVQTALVIPSITATVSSAETGAEGANTTEVYQVDLFADVDIFAEDADRNMTVDFDEQGAVKIGGWLESGGDVRSITLTDELGNQLTVSNGITVEQESGWSYFETEVDVSSLEDGTISISTRATDAVGNNSIATTSIEKQTDTGDNEVNLASKNVFVSHSTVAANADFYGLETTYVLQIDG